MLDSSQRIQESNSRAFPLVSIQTHQHGGSSSPCWIRTSASRDQSPVPFRLANGLERGPFAQPCAPTKRRTNAHIHRGWFITDTRHDNKLRWTSSWSHIKYVRFFENENYFFISKIWRLWAAKFSCEGSARSCTGLPAGTLYSHRFLMRRTTREPAKQDEWSGGKSCVQVPSCSVHNLPEKKESIFLKPIFSAFFRIFFWMKNTACILQRIRNKDHCKFWFFLQLVIDNWPSIR